MGTNTLNRKCPKCKRKRTYRPANHYFSSGLIWEKRNNVWICPWCIARESIDGENKLRAELKKLRENRRR